MKGFRRWFLVVVMLFSLVVSIGADDTNTMIVEFDEEGAIAMFNCMFMKAANGAPALVIGYYSFIDVPLFMPEFTVEQEHSLGKYDIFGIEGLINVASPAWYNMGDNVPAKQAISMYVMLPYTFRYNEDTTVYFETVNGMIWHQFKYGRPDSKTMETTYWYNGKQLQN